MVVHVLMRDRALASGVSRTAFAQDLLSSSELDVDVNVIDNFYISILGRAPDLTGLQGWLTFLRGGGSIEAMAEAFLMSPEYLSAVH
jgi:hypothetical protein